MRPLAKLLVLGRMSGFQVTPAIGIPVFIRVQPSVNGVELEGRTRKSGTDRYNHQVSITGTLHRLIAILTQGDEGKVRRLTSCGSPLLV